MRKLTRRKYYDVLWEEFTNHAKDVFLKLRAFFEWETHPMHRSKFPVTRMKIRTAVATYR